MALSTNEKPFGDREKMEPSEGFDLLLKRSKPNIKYQNPCLPAGRQMSNE